jgi:pyruvate,water dikinase
LRPAGAANAVLVARTLLPTELPLVDAAALVTETGGPLDHVAAQARERNLPAVVGAAGAMSTLTEGELVLVDGDRGLVVRLG